MATIGLGYRKLVLAEINGALYSNEYQYSSRLAHSLQCLFLYLLIIRTECIALICIIRIHTFEMILKNDGCMIWGEQIPLHIV